MARKKKNKRSWRDQLAATGVGVPRDVTYIDAQDGWHAKYRRAEREAEMVRVLDQLLAEQKETNRLLALIASSGSATVPPPPRVTQVS